MTGKPKRGLADFLSQEFKSSHEVQTAEVPNDRSTEPAKSRTSEVPKSRSVEVPEVRAAVVPEVRTAEVPEARAVVVPEVRTAEVPKSRSAEPAKSQTHEVPKSRSAEVPVSRAPPLDEGAESGEPLYLRLTRKEVRFRDAQLEALYAMARRLSRARRGAKGDAKADRITENTLVRVAVDLLLLHGDELAGHDEPSLLESLRKLSRKKA